MKIFFAVVVLCRSSLRAGLLGSGSTLAACRLPGFQAEAPARAWFRRSPRELGRQHACNPPGGTYDTEVVLGTTNNIGPNVAGSAIGTPYALTPAGVFDVVNNWRDNADNASQTPHYADQFWRLKIPNQSSGTVLHCTSYDANERLHISSRKDEWQRGTDEVHGHRIHDSAPGGADGLQPWPARTRGYAQPRMHDRQRLHVEAPNGRLGWPQRRHPCRN